MKNTLLLLASLFVINAFSQDKKLWAKSIINQKAPKLVVEKWLSDKPDTPKLARASRSCPQQLTL